MLTRLAKATAAAIRTFRRRLQARYEGAQPGGGRRSYIPAFLQDARFDADGATRSELVRKSRYFERNSALMNAFCDRFEQFTVGSNGLQLTPASTDEEWNLRAMEWWSEWCQFPDLTSLQPLSSIQSLIARTWFVDGEVFILKTKGSSMPRIQLIESHRVGTPPRQWDQEGRLLVDGVEMDKRGRPAAYWVRDGFDFEDYRRIPAESIIHVFEPPRNPTWTRWPESLA